MKRIFLYIILILSVAACANPGSGPDGGPYDETPPRILSTTPQIGATGAKANKVTLTFDEIVKMENANEKLTISPPQINAPDIKTVGRKISVQLNDSLKANTTYTLDFSDAIEDNNEGNPLGNYTFYYSTGQQIDTMEVSGHVITANNLEPVKGILVGLQSNLSDSAFRTMPFERVARTDGSGHFTIRGIAPGTYRIYALKDADGNYMFSQKSEMIAFQTATVTPKAEPALRYDTLWRDSLHYDTIQSVNYTRYTPDDIVLKAFTENGQPRHLLKTTRQTPQSFSAYFTAPSTFVPKVKGLNFRSDDAFLEERSQHNDTITYWLKNNDLVKQDTLRLAYTYDETDDSTGRMQMRTDTLELVPRLTYAKMQEKQQKLWDEWNKKRDKALKKGKEFTEDPPRQWLTLNYRVASSLPPDENISLEFLEPIARIDSSKIHLKLGPDSAGVERDYELIKLPYKELKYVLRGEWRPKQEYRLLVDSAAFTGMSGLINNALDLHFKIANPEEFGSLFFNVSGVDSAIVQIFTDESRIYRQTKTKGGRADFFYVSPGKYYTRLFVDLNGNGRWDTGDYEKGTQPEPVYYYPDALNLRAGWDINQDWNVNATPILRQKPEAIVKQKADKKKTVKSRNAERLRDKGQ